MNRILFKTLGCRLNQAETDSYKEELAKKGFQIAENGKFDIAVINTCAVTHKADREGRQAVRKLKRQCPKAKIVMTGCSDFKLPEVDYYIKDKEKFVKKILSQLSSPSPDMERGTVGVRTGVKTRSNIKIQTGCDNCCAYCYTRISRGKSRSLNPKQIIQQIKRKEKQDIKEIVLTGVNIGQYKYDDLDLTGLIKRILSQTNILRIRLSSINPEYVLNNKKFQNLFKNKRLCQHLHLSLQSGSNKILQKMNRHYTRKQYLSIVKKYYQAYPLFGFTTDIIVGFPSETESDFKDSITLINQCCFLKIHVFRYSARLKTPAAKMKDQVNEEIKNERSLILQKINLQLQKDFQKKLIGKKISVLFESKKNNLWFGYAGNYFPVYYKNSQDLNNQMKIIQWLYLKLGDD